MFLQHRLAIEMFEVALAARSKGERLADRAIGVDWARTDEFREPICHRWLSRTHMLTHTQLSNLYEEP